MNVYEIGLILFIFSDMVFLTVYYLETQNYKDLLSEKEKYYSLYMSNFKKQQDLFNKITDIEILTLYGFLYFDDKGFYNFRYENLNIKSENFNELIELSMKSIINKKMPNHLKRTLRIKK